MIWYFQIQIIYFFFILFLGIWKRLFLMCSCFTEAFSRLDISFIGSSRWLASTSHIVVTLPRAAVGFIPTNRYEKTDCSYS